MATTRGAFSAADFRIVATGRGGHLQLLDLHDDGGEFAGADLTISATPTLAGGNGRVDVGYLDARGSDLHDVRIAGDLGRIDSGDGDGKYPALHLLAIQSLGARGQATQGGGNLTSQFSGDVSKVMAGTIRGAVLEASGSIREVSVAGSIVGGRLSVGAAFGTITVGRDILGTAASPVVISAVGRAAAPASGLDAAIGSLRVGRDVESLRVLAGYDSAGLAKNADASVVEVVIGGNWKAGTLLAGVGAGLDGFEGTLDDAVLSGAGVRDHPNIVSQISRLIIGGTVAGSAAGGDSFGIIAERIASGRIGLRLLPFEPGAHSPGDFFPRGSTGPGPTGLSRDFAIGEVKV